MRIKRKPKIKIQRRPKPKVEDLELGRIFFVPFENSDKGVFGYIKYAAATRTNPRSLEFSMGDIYDRVCKLEDWSEDIKQEKIKIFDILILSGFFRKIRDTRKPMLLTDQYTNIIQPVKYGFFRNDSDWYWYDADAKDIVYPDDDSQYRWVTFFGGGPQAYIEPIFNGENINYCNFGRIALPRPRH